MLVFPHPARDHGRAQRASIETVPSAFHRNTANAALDVYDRRTHQLPYDRIGRVGLGRPRVCRSEIPDTRPKVDDFGATADCSAEVLEQHWLAFSRILIGAAITISLALVWCLRAFPNSADE